MIWRAPLKFVPWIASCHKNHISDLHLDQNGKRINEKGNALSGDTKVYAQVIYHDHLWRGCKVQFYDQISFHTLLLHTYIPVDLLKQVLKPKENRISVFFLKVEINIIKHKSNWMSLQCWEKRETAAQLELFFSNASSNGSFVHNETQNQLSTENSIKKTFYIFFWST